MRIYQVDAFTNKVYSGNPAAVVMLDQESGDLSDEAMQRIAAENNLSGTAFVKTIDHEEATHDVRWFTPKVEIDLCGNATVAAAFVLFFIEGYSKDMVVFNSRCGLLTICREGDIIWMEFPADNLEPIEAPEALWDALGLNPVDKQTEIYRGREDILVVFDDEALVKEVVPDYKLLDRIDSRGVIVTAPAADKDIDFVSRFFAPHIGVYEDPATGSAHTTLTTFWAERMGMKVLTAKQLSTRSNRLMCRLYNDRVEIGSQAVLYMSGEISG